MKHAITIVGTGVCGYISNELMLRILHEVQSGGGKLFHDLEPGLYKICGKRIDVSLSDVNTKRFIATDSPGAYSFIDLDCGRWLCQCDFERYIGKPTREVTPEDIVPIPAEEGTNPQ